MSSQSADEKLEAGEPRPNIRAALMLRNVGSIALDPTMEEALEAIAIEMNVGRSDLIRMALREWLEARLAAGNN
jgi:hypothetical protein